MSAFTFNSRLYVERLKKAGFDEMQANTQAEALEQAFEEAQCALATKHDLLELDNHLTDKLTLRMGAMFVANVTILSVILALFKLF